MSHRSRFGSAARLLSVALVVILAVPSLSGAGKWKMAKEATPIYYKMQTTSVNRRGERKVIFEVDIQATEEKDAKGNPMFKVRTTQEMMVPARELGGGQLAFGSMSMAWASAAGNMQWIMYQGLLGQLELTVGEKMSYFGGMLAKVESKETIAGHEGFVVKMYNTTKDEPVLLAELVVKPEIPVALRARSYDKKGTLTSENLMIKIETR